MRYETIKDFVKEQQVLLAEICCSLEEKASYTIEYLSAPVRRAAVGNGFECGKKRSISAHADLLA